MSSSLATIDDAAIPPRAARYVLRRGTVLSMDPAVGDFAEADVLIEGTKIAAIRPNLDAGDAPEIDAAGKIVMPGFVDTHHHGFETALRGWLANGLLADDGHPHGAVNYKDHVLGRLSPAYAPEDVYASARLGALSQLDAGVTTALDVSQIHHSPEHTDAAIAGLADSGARVVFGYFEGQGAQARYPQDAVRIAERYFSSRDQRMTLVMGGEIYLPGYERAWKLGRELGVPIAAHIVGTFGMGPAFAAIARSGAIGPDNLFIHMTGVDERTWRITADAGAAISLAVPIEMMMRHGAPPILQALAVGIEPSLSSDVECTMTADPFTQMRFALAMQRSAVNEAALANVPALPALLTARDVIRFATLRGAQSVWLGDTVGSLTPGKEADVVVLDATAINVAPLNNAPAAVVTLMERSNVETVIVGGTIRKWQGKLVDVDLAALRSEITASRDRVFARAGIEPHLFAD